MTSTRNLKIGDWFHPTLQEIDKKIKILTFQGIEEIAPETEKEKETEVVAAIDQREIDNQWIVTVTVTEEIVIKIDEEHVALVGKKSAVKEAVVVTETETEIETDVIGIAAVTEIETEIEIETITIPNVGEINLQVEIKTVTMIKTVTEIKPLLLLPPPPKTSLKRDLETEMIKIKLIVLNVWGNILHQ